MTPAHPQMSKSKKELKESKKSKAVESLSSSLTLKVEKKKKKKKEEKKKLKIQIEAELEREKQLEKEREAEVARIKESDGKKALEKECEREKESERLEKKAAKKAAKKLLKESEKKSSKSSKGIFEINSALFDPITPVASIESGQKPSVVTQKPSFPKPVPKVSPVASAAASVAVRKPVSIKIPRSSRPTLESNPHHIVIPRVSFFQSPSERDSEFIIRGVNDTEESRILVNTFADKWYLPATLYQMEASTGLKYRRGRFSEDEKDLAKRLTLKFCQDQHMNLDEFQRVFFDEMGSRDGENATANSRRLSTFFIDVAQHFGGRPVVSVYECLKRLFHPGNHRGPWTPEEDETLLLEYQKHGPKWTLIGKELNRLGVNCRDRFNLKWKNSDQTMSTGFWSSVESKKLADGIADSLRESGVISWIWISEERVKTRTPLQCLSHYKSKAYIHRDTLPAPRPAVINWNGWKDDEDYLLIFAILNSGSTAETQINWRTLKVEGIPLPRHNHELFFRRWNFLKSKAGISGDEETPAGTSVVTLKEQVDRIKRYLVGKSKSAAYIFSEDEEDI